MKKRTPAIILAILVLLPVLGAAAETMYCIIPTGQYVNVRKQADKTASTWGEMRNGERIDADTISDGWVTFDYGEHTAYAMVKFFEIPEDTDFVITGNGRVRYREEPNGKKVDFYEVGTVVHVDGWRYDGDGNLWGRVGNYFVSYEFLEPAADDNM